MWQHIQVSCYKKRNNLLQSIIINRTEIENDRHDAETEIYPKIKAHRGSEILKIQLLTKELRYNFAQNFKK